MVLRESFGGTSGEIVLLDHYRKNLRAVVGSAAAPYGYTLSVWAAGAALVSVHGIPRTLAHGIRQLGAV